MQYLENLNLETGYLCLDFSNTVDWHASDNPEESLFTYGDLTKWAGDVGVLEADTVQKLQREADNSPDEAEAVYTQAIELREAIYRIFSAVARKDSPVAGDLDILHELWPQATAHFFLEQTGDAFRWTWKAGAEDDLDQILWPVVRSAVGLLTSEQLDRVRECADDRGCGYLFFDTSRNRSRRWCSMESCGNRAKAQRFYMRQHEHDE